jgi:hypothetical protein
MDPKSKTSILTSDLQIKCVLKQVMRRVEVSLPGESEFNALRPTHFALRLQGGGGSTEE